MSRFGLRGRRETAAYFGCALGHKINKRGDIREESDAAANYRPSREEERRA